MAATLLYAVVGNIPNCYHSKDLRNFFSRFIETDSFDCFHFRHRPEARETERKPESSSDCTQNTQETHGTSKNPKLPGTCCCVIRLPETQHRDLVQMYDCRHWITEKGESMRSVCHISKIKLSSRTRDDNIEPQYKTHLEQSRVSSDREEFYEEDLKNLVELHPPTVMPKGNVGTPTIVFLDLIRQCLLPPKIISKLKLKFPEMVINKKYRNVPFDYEDSGQDQENVSVCWLPVKSGSGHELQLGEEAAREKEPNGTVQSPDGEKDARDAIVGVAENCSVGAKQRMLGCVTAAGDSDQTIEDKEVEESKRRNQEVEAELVKEREEMEEKEESDHEEEEEREGLDKEENRNSSHQWKKIKVVEVDQEEKRNQWEEREERELQKEGTDEEMEDIERKNGSPEEEKEGERKKETEYKEGQAKNDKTNKEDIKENVRSFKEVISQGHQNQEITEENVKMLNNEKIDEEMIKKEKKELEKQKAKEKRKHEMAVRRKKMALRIEEKMIEFERGSDHSEDDVDECEEWERHEALHDDPSNQERNEERLFEQEIELKWEKGGSGLVFYTDAQFWKQQEGDFDEQTADDWDVDMSGYYEPGSGDMDGRDLIRIRRDQRRRDGMEDGDGSIAGIGKFEKHTKGFGRRIMEQHGWKDGEGLGSSASGITEALTNDGQNPRCKAGIGFQEPKRGKKADTFYKRQEMQEWHGPIISTVYDDPSVTDPVDPLLRRNEPYQLKRRKIDDVSSS